MLPPESLKRHFQHQEKPSAAHDLVKPIQRSGVGQVFPDDKVQILRCSLRTSLQE
jgi:hypothetical protein